MSSKKKKQKPQFGPEEQAEIERLVLEYQQRRSFSVFRLLWSQLQPLLWGVYEEVGFLLSAKDDQEEAWAAIRAALLQAVEEYRPVDSACTVALALERDMLDDLRPRTRPAGRGLGKESSFSFLFAESQERLASVCAEEAPEYRPTFANELRDCPYRLIDQAVLDKELTPIDRALLLAWSEERNLVEVAAELGITVGYANKRLSLAKKALRELFAEEASCPG